MALRPEECNKLARPSFACSLSSAKSLVEERLRLCYAPVMWYVTFDALEPAQVGDSLKSCPVARESLGRWRVAQELLGHWRVA
jgi:hypothetical protein